MDNSIRSSAAAYRAGYDPGRARGRVETAADRLGPVPTVRAARPTRRPASPKGAPRRGRRAARLRAVACAVAAMLVLLALLAAAKAGVGADEPEPTVVAHVVASSDTLWSIASDYADRGSDLRALTADIREANGMTGSNLRAGQRIFVPVRGG